MPLPGGYLFDTNIFVHLIRNDLFGQFIRSTYGLLSGYNAIRMSIVTVGELEALVRKRNWQAAKQMQLSIILSQVSIIDISDVAILSAYGDIDAACDAAGKPMGKNDVWIAATARAANATLLTSDSDFDFIHGTWIDREWVDPASKLTP